MTIELTILGTATPYPRPDSACSGYLLRTATARVWVDAGPGSLANLQRHTSPELLSAIWISHLHADHAADLLSVYYALAFADLRPTRRIPLYAPAGCGQRLAGFFAKPDPGFLDEVFDIHELHDGHRVEFDGLRLTSRLVRHDVEGYGLRAEHRGRTVVYSGDTGPCPALDELATEADLFLCEADVTDRPTGSEQWHLTPEDAGAAAGRARVRRLLITHVGPTMTPDQAAERSAVVFGGPTSTAREGQTHTVSSAGL